MKIAGLPLELKVGFLNLIEWDLHRPCRRDLKVEGLVFETGKLTFEASLPFDCVTHSNAKFLTDYAFKIARPAEFALYPR